jgi:hypothetical protein
MGRIPLYPSRDTQMAIIDLAAKMKISELYAAQYALNLGLYQLNVKSKEAYERDVRVFSAKLVRDPEPKPLSFQEQKDQQRILEKQRWFESVKSEWHLDHKALASGKSWREDVVEQAELWKDRLPKDAGGSNVAFEVLALWSQTYLLVKQDVKL